MKKAIFFTVFVFLSVSSFADSKISNRYIFIEGTAEREGHLEFFLLNLRREASAAGYIVTKTANEAAFTIKFDVSSALNSRGEPIPSAGNNQFVVRISLVNNTDDSEVLGFDFFFTSLYEVYSYTRTLFQEATVYIPPLIEGGLALDESWKNKWIYLRLSFDYPVTFYTLLGNDLIGGLALHSKEDPNDTDNMLDPQDHKVMAMPGFTAGFEFQLGNFFSVELNYKLSWGDTRNNYFINMGLGAELKFPIKFQSIVLVPYGAFSFPLTISDIFDEFPPFAFGAGVQVCAKGGKNGAFFVDINYMLSLTDAVMHNPYVGLSLSGSDLYPFPAVIHYNRSVIGIGIGYKIGFIDR